jgi:hypothetical protein
MRPVTVCGRAVDHGTLVEIAETTRVVIRIECDVEPKVELGGEPVPMALEGRSWVSVDNWSEIGNTEHLVGDMKLQVATGDDTISATVRRAPTRITTEQYEYMVRRLRAAVGQDAIDDPLERARVWAAFAPDLPSHEDERAAVLIQLFERAAPALRAIAARPSEALTRIDEWVAVSRLGTVRGRVDARRIRSWDPPRPATAPTLGTVLLVRNEALLATPENRFVRAVAARLADALARSVVETSPRCHRQIVEALSDLDDWFGRGDWLDVTPGPLPAHSFVLRDHAAYRTVVSLANQLDHLPGLAVRFPPGELERLLPISPASLNTLYERWVQLVVFEWLVERLGRPQSGFAGTGKWAWMPGTNTVALLLDRPFPRSASTGVVCRVGKNRPDVAIEHRDLGGTITLLVLDATYSQNPAIVDEKLRYAHNFVDAGARHALTGDPPLVTRWCAAATPAALVSVVEMGADLARARLNLPPSIKAEQLLASYLDVSIGRLFTAG